MDTRDEKTLKPVEKGCPVEKTATFLKSRLHLREGTAIVQNFTERLNMVKIRLRKTGCINNPSFRVVATDQRSPRDGKFLEILGWYAPKQKGENYKLDLPRIDYWLSQGAQMSETVASMVKKTRKAAAAQPAAAPAEA